MSIKVLEEKTIHRQGKIDFVKQQVELPNGKITQKTILRHPGAVAMVPLTGEGDVILVEQYRFAIRQNILEIPAGTLEPGEDPIKCAERELQEEAGFFPGELVFLADLVMIPGISNESIKLYLARDLRPSRLPADDDELIQVIKMPFSEALEQIRSGKIRDAKTIIGLLQAQAFTSEA
jgi:ADP-ribose pyrophosphatase